MTLIVIGTFAAPHITAQAVGTCIALGKLKRQQQGLYHDSALPVLV